MLFCSHCLSASLGCLICLFVCVCVVEMKVCISRWKTRFCLFLALNMTSASSFQMLRGAVIIFTGLLSVAFLGRRLAPSQWLGILTTILGLVIVGLADLFSGHRDDTHKLSDIITGKATVINPCAQSTCCRKSARKVQMIKSEIMETYLQT